MGLRRRRGAPDLRAEKGEHPDGKSLLRRALTSVTVCLPQPEHEAEAARGRGQPSIVACGRSCKEQSPGTADPTPGHCNGNNQVMTTPTY